MKKNCKCGLNDLFDLFSEELSVADIISSQILCEISKSIAECRLEMNMDQKQFASFMGVTQSMVSKWESEDYNFTIKSLANIISKLDLNLLFSLEHNHRINSKSVGKFTVYTSEKVNFLIGNTTIPDSLMPTYTTRYTDKNDFLQVICD